MIKNNPTDPSAFYYRGLANLKLSNFSNAYNDFTSAISLGLGDRDIFSIVGL